MGVLLGAASECLSGSSKYYLVCFPWGPPPPGPSLVFSLGFSLDPGGSRRGSPRVISCLFLAFSADVLSVLLVVLSVVVPLVSPRVLPGLPLGFSQVVLPGGFPWIGFGSP